MILGVVFVTGAAILIVEVVATRILAPYFGNTIFTFSSVIGVILAALSCGYYFGGTLADRKPSHGRFYLLIFLGGISVLAIKIIVIIWLPKLGHQLSLMSGPLIVSCLLFFVPAVLLGTLSPFAIKLQHDLDPEQGIGRVAGKVFFWSTVGSIVGTLTAGFYLIPHFGVKLIISSVGYFLTVMGGIGLLVHARRRAAVITSTTVLILLFALTDAILPEGTPSNVLYEQDGYYERIRIQDGTYQGRSVRVLMQDLSSNSAMFLDTGRMAFDYTKYYQLYQIFTPHIQKALAIGGGAYSVPKDLLNDEPHIQIDVVEIEPSLYELAKQFFGLQPDDRIRNYVEDGRQFLYRSQDQYDFIFSDVYYSFASVPMHCTTREFFQIALDKLTPEGLFVGNFVGSLAPEGQGLIFSVIKTMQAVFPQIYVFAIVDPQSEKPQNFMLVGHNSPLRLDIDSLPLKTYDSEILQNLKNKQIQVSQLELSPYPLLTDDYAPLEYLSAQIIRKYNDILRPTPAKL